MSEVEAQSHVFQADVARLLYLMVHSVYSDRDIFLRELLSNAADACEKLRYEALSNPSLMASEAPFSVKITIDKEAGQLSVEDNGIGMSAEELSDSLGTIARSGTKAYLDKLTAESTEGQPVGAELIGQFGIGFYAAFMVAEHVDVESRRAGSDEAHVWSSDGKGTFSIAPLALDKAPARGTRVILTLNEGSKDYSRRLSHRADRSRTFGRARHSDRTDRFARCRAEGLERGRRALGKAQKQHHKGAI